MVLVKNFRNAISNDSIKLLLLEEWCILQFPCKQEICNSRAAPICFPNGGTNVIGYLSFAGNNSERVDKQLFLISLQCFLHAKFLFCQNIFVRDVCASILHKIIREELYCKCQKFPPELKNRSAAAVTSSKTYFLEL